MTPFTLPQVCDCGARGAVTFEPAPPPPPGENDPDPTIVAAEGSFDIDGSGEIVCRSCGERLGNHHHDSP